MIGDGYTEPIRCENLEEDISDREPDACSVTCEWRRDEISKRPARVCLPQFADGGQR